ncbi:MAG: NYN domain-containing protein [Patescibacteria group bacterium]
MKNERNNIAFIDGQNLYFGTTKCYICAEKLGISIKDIKFSDCTCGKAWKINLKKFRIYLKKKYDVEKAYYFLGCVNEEFQDLYDKIQEAGFILKFREHTTIMLGKKKGNVDSDIIFDVMKRIYKNEEFNKIIIISGDGDYKKLIDFLVEENRFKKILFPNKKFASSLYNNLGSEFFDWLENENIKNKIKL